LPIVLVLCPLTQNKEEEREREREMEGEGERKRERRIAEEQSTSDSGGNGPQWRFGMKREGVWAEGGEGKAEEKQGA
jgi:hypothetical protein